MRLMNTKESFINIQERLKLFSESEIKPRAREIDLEQKMPIDLIKKIAEQKFFSVVFPETLGGYDIDPVEFGLFLEDAGKYCSNVRNLFLVNMSMVGLSILKWGTPKQINEWIPQIMAGTKIGAFSITEPEVGSDSININTTFQKKGNEYIINGKKKWTTLGGIADLFLVVAKNKSEIGVFIVEKDRKGICIEEIKGLLGNRGSHIAEIDFSNVAVSQENILGDIETGLNKVVTFAFETARYCASWSSIALAQACLEEMISYSRKRSQFGKKIRTFQFVQEIIGNAVINIHAAKALALYAGKLRKENSVLAFDETNITKVFCSRIVNEIAADAIQIHGGNGYCSEYPVERYFREAKAFEIIEGTTQILLQLISKNALING